MPAREEILGAIEAHISWKRRLEEAIESESWASNSEFALDGIRDDTRCQLGRWLHGESCRGGARSDYCCVEGLHRQFHEAAAQVLELALAGWTDAARAALGPDEEYCRLSRELIRALDAMAQGECWDERALVVGD
jgi:hypothetical protein